MCYFESPNTARYLAKLLLLKITWTLSCCSPGSCSIRSKVIGSSEAAIDDNRSSANDYDKQKTDMCQIELFAGASLYWSISVMIFFVFCSETVLVKQPLSVGAQKGNGTSLRAQAVARDKREV